jgi:prevent-host-death family protein
MKTASIADMKARFSAYIRQSEKGPVVITRKGRPVGVLLGVKDEDEIEQLILGYTPRLRPLVEAWEERIREGKGRMQADLGGEMEAKPTQSPKPARARPKKGGERKA